MSRAPTLHDAQGRRIDLGECLGRGGEGAVYALGSDRSLVAKVYREPPPREKAEKIVTMAAAAAPDLLTISAWPTGTLHAGAGGRLVGLLMPRVDGYKEIHALYSPAQRKQDFPRADWAFLVHAGRNVASAFAAVHRHGHVIGDVNQGNVVVSGSATVKLIDCDSFQISAGGRRFLCEVGVAHFTPPELQGGSFRGVVRGPEHDRFGLAVLLFHLLFMGRHPFAGIFSGKGDMPIERAIREGRFAYGRAAPSLQMRPPPHVLPLAQASSRVGELFERAFAPPGKAVRPPAHEWIDALDALKGELRVCGDHRGHRYAQSAGSCPWCAIERGGGPDFFVAVAVSHLTASGFDLARFWRDVEAIQVPTAALLHAFGNPPAAARGRPLPAKARWSHLAAQGCGGLASFLFLGALAGEGILFAAALTMLAVMWILNHIGGYEQEHVARKQALRAAEEAHRAVTSRWAREVGDPAEQFASRRKEMERMRDEYRGLAAAYQRDRAELSSKVHEHQLRRFLDCFLIAHAAIKGVGPARVGALASFGIETAADVSRRGVLRVPGFGPKLTTELLAWRASVERRFVFDPNRGVDPADVAALDQRYAAKRQNLERGLAERVGDLRRLSTAAQRARETVEPDLRKVASALASARADAAAA